MFQAFLHLFSHSNDPSYKSFDYKFVTDIRRSIGQTININTKITILESNRLAIMCPIFKYQKKEQELLVSNLLLDLWGDLLDVISLPNVPTSQLSFVHSIIMKIIIRHEFLLEDKQLPLDGDERNNIERYVKLLHSSVVYASKQLPNQNNTVEILDFCTFVISAGAIRFHQIMDYIIDGVRVATEYDLSRQTTVLNEILEASLSRKDRCLSEPMIDLESIRNVSSDSRVIDARNNPRKILSIFDTNNDESDTVSNAIQTDGARKSPIHSTDLDRPILGRRASRFNRHRPDTPRIERKIPYEPRRRMNEEMYSVSSRRHLFKESDQNNVFNYAQTHARTRSTSRCLTPRHFHSISGNQPSINNEMTTDINNYFKAKNVNNLDFLENIIINLQKSNTFDKIISISDKENFYGRFPSIFRWSEYTSNFQFFFRTSEWIEKLTTNAEIYSLFLKNIHIILDDITDHQCEFYLISWYIDIIKVLPIILISLSVQMRDFYSGKTSTKKKRRIILNNNNRSRETIIECIDHILLNKSLFNVVMRLLIDTTNLYCVRNVDFNIEILQKWLYLVCKTYSSYNNQIFQVIPCHQSDIIIKYTSNLEEYSRLCDISYILKFIYILLSQENQSVLNKTICFFYNIIILFDPDVATIIVNYTVTDKALFFHLFCHWNPEVRFNFSRLICYRTHSGPRSHMPWKLDQYILKSASDIISRMRNEKKIPAQLASFEFTNSGLYEDKGIEILNKMDKKFKNIHIPDCTNELETKYRIYKIESYIHNMFLSLVDPLHLYLDQQYRKYALHAVFQYSFVLMEYYEYADNLRKTKPNAGPALVYELPSTIKEIDF